MGKKTKEKIDTIGRDEIIQNISNIVESVSQNRGNTTFAIDGVWGCGKTFVLEKLEQKLSKIENEETGENKYFIIHYNSWKYDYYEEPLVAIVSSIVSSLDENKIIKNPKTRIVVKEVFKEIGMALLDLANASVKKITGIDVKDKISSALESAKKIKKKSKKKIKEANKYDGYFDLKNLLGQLKKSLNQLSEEYTIVFIVDELDRCLPEYAIKVLERLHHLTEDIENTITIIGTDRSKLEGVVSKIFGYEENDCSNYLKKFIKFSINLDVGTSQESIKEKYSYYINLFNQDFLEDKINFTEFFNILFARIDVREQENLIEKAFLLHTLLTKENMDTSIMYTELILLVMEHYYKVRKAGYFRSGKFENGSSLTTCPSLNKLNSILLPKSEEFMDSKAGRPYWVVNKYSGNKGAIYWYFSMLANEDQPENRRYFWFINETLDGNYKEISDKNYEFVKMFNSLLHTIK